MLYVFDDLPGLIGEFESYSRELRRRGGTDRAIRDKSTIIVWMPFAHRRLPESPGAQMQTVPVDFYGSPSITLRSQARTDAEIDALLEAHRADHSSITPSSPTFSSDGLRGARNFSVELRYYDGSVYRKHNLGWLAPRLYRA